MTDADKYLLKQTNKMQYNSKQKRLQYERRWADNIKLLKGIPLQDKSTYSETRRRNKIYYRKIWSISWRLVSALWSSILRDPNNFKISGRDGELDVVKASVLTEMLRYRIDKMESRNNLFIKHIWALKNIVELGWCAGKLHWKYDEEAQEDYPDYTLYPPEQIYLDFSVDSKDKMRYVIFENYMTKDELIENGYENIDEAVPNNIDSSQVKAARNMTNPEPYSNMSGNSYPEGQSNPDGDSDIKEEFYKVWEVFYKERGKIYFYVTNGNHCVLKSKDISPYGKKLPIILGLCLTEQHKLIGEGLPEALEGPQESYNFIMNMRKDNIALALNAPTLLQRGIGVDLNALTNRGPRNVIMADDINGIKEMPVNDVTASSYKEAQVDVGMMEDVSGITAVIQGMDTSGTATQSQINLAQGTAKIDLYAAIVASTYYKDFISTLAYYIQKFETDDSVFRIANVTVSLRDGKAMLNPYDIDFDADISVSVGQNIGIDQEIRQALLILDRGNMYNQSQMQLLQTGVVKPGDQITLFNGSQIFTDLLNVLRKKETSKYFINVGAPGDPTQLAGSDGVEALRGVMQPQVGNMADMMPQNELQMGAYGN